MNSYEIVPVHLAVTSMRDSGYKNAAYAIAELIDNSVQAKATTIELLCMEKEEVVTQRTRSRIDQVAVLDNGTGMSPSALRQALQFGNGEYLKDRSGIGRFGMGLPNSSLSQARRVDVWTWQSGPENAIHSYLDLGEIEAGSMREVPAASSRAIPAVWMRAGTGLGRSGTLVVWSTLDRCQWVTAKAIIRNSEQTIGRTYRRFISDSRIRIRLASFVGHPRAGFAIDEYAQPNDPLYLMERSSCPEPWSKVAMFEPYGSDHIIDFAQGGETHKVKIRFSVAKKEARAGHNPGAKPHGEHAKGNVGVSIMRSERELELQTGWTNHYDTRERWWGAEVEIPATLDEIFGVTNDKQSARALADYSITDSETIALREGYPTIQALKAAWTEDGDPRLLLLNVKGHIETNLNAIRRRLETEHRSTEVDQRHPGADSAERKGTEAIRQRQLGGHRGTSDEQEKLPTQKREEQIAEDLKSSGLSSATAVQKAAMIVQSGRKFDFVHADLETSAFFTVRPKGGTILIQLNTNHPAYQHLVALMEDAPKDSDVARLRERMVKSYEGLKLLIEAWARYEDELPEAKKDIARDARSDWGRIAREFMRE